MAPTYYKSKNFRNNYDKKDYFRKRKRQETFSQKNCLITFVKLCLLFSCVFLKVKFLIFPRHCDFLVRSRERERRTWRLLCTGSGGGNAEPGTQPPSRTSHHLASAESWFLNRSLWLGRYRTVLGTRDADPVHVGIGPDPDKFQIWHDSGSSELLHFLPSSNFLFMLIIKTYLLF